MFVCPATEDFFRLRLDHMIDLRHPLAVLASRLPWQEIEARVAQVFARKARVGVAMPGGFQDFCVKIRPGPTRPTVCRRW